MLALTALGWALGCGQPAATERGQTAAGPQHGGTAVVAAASDVTGFHPLFDAETTFNKGVLDALFLQLFEEQPDFAEGPPTFAPELAVSWQWSDDDRELSIELRPDVVWSDGTPLTAEDVVWTWQRQTDERLGWTHAGMKESIVSIEAVDATRLRVRFVGPSPARLAELNEGHILPRHRWRQLPLDQWRESGGWFRDNLVVSGPFQLTEWRPDQQIVLERNPAYHRAGYPRLDRVVFRIVPEPNSRLSQLLAGTVDFTSSVPPLAIPRIEKSPAARLESSQTRQYNYIHWNLQRPALAEIEARQALTMAIDRQRIVETLWHGRARVASSPIVSSAWAHRADPGPWPHDPARAAELLAALGWRDEDGDGFRERHGTTFDLELATNADRRVRTDALVMIQEDLRRVGINARVRRMDWNAVVERLNQGEFEGTLLAFSIDTSLDLSYAFHSDSIRGNFNFGGYSNPEVDRLLDAALAARQTSERGRLLGELQGILHREQPFTLLWEPQRLNGLSHRLRGTRPNHLGPLFQIEEWWLAPG